MRWCSDMRFDMEAQVELQKFSANYEEGGRMSYATRGIDAQQKVLGTFEDSTVVIVPKECQKRASKILGNKIRSNIEKRILKNIPC